MKTVTKVRFSSLCLCSIAFLSLVSSGCVRYTPSQKEIASSNNTDDGKTAGELIADKEAFFEFEKNQQQRLQELVATRNTQAGTEAGSTYRVGVGDVLEFNVFDVEEFKDTTVRVRPSGFISLPLVGAVKVTGLSETEVQDEVTKRLGQFIRHPQVNVFISEYAANKVSVIGEVFKPGSYVLKRTDYSLIELLSEAGGRKEKSSGRIILIPGKEVVTNVGSTSVASTEQQLALAEARASLSTDGSLNGIEIYFDDLAGSSKKNPISIPLRPGDTIVVPEAGEVQVDGEIKKPGSVPLSSRMTLLGAIASAGGLTYAADVASVEVIRELQSGKKALFSVDLEKLAIAEGQDIRLRDGDVIRVPSSGGRFITRQVVDVLNSIVSFGVGLP